MLFDCKSVDKKLIFVAQRVFNSHRSKTWPEVHFNNSNLDSQSSNSFRSVYPWRLLLADRKQRCRTRRDVSSVISGWGAPPCCSPTRGLHSPSSGADWTKCRRRSLGHLPRTRAPGADGTNIQFDVGLILTARVTERDAKLCDVYSTRQFVCQILYLPAACWISTVRMKTTLNSSRFMPFSRTPSAALASLCQVLSSSSIVLPQIYSKHHIWVVLLFSTKRRCCACAGMEFRKSTVHGAWFSAPLFVPTAFPLKFSQFSIAQYDENTIQWHGILSKEITSWRIQLKTKSLVQTFVVDCEFQPVHAAAELEFVDGFGDALLDSGELRELLIDSERRAVHAHNASAGEVQLIQDVVYRPTEDCGDTEKFVHFPLEGKPSVFWTLAARTNRLCLSWTLKNVPAVEGMFVRTFEHQTFVRLHRTVPDFQPAIRTQQPQVLVRCFFLRTPHLISPGFHPPPANRVLTDLEKKALVREGEQLRVVDVAHHGSYENKEKQEGLQAVAPFFSSREKPASNIMHVCLLLSKRNQWPKTAAQLAGTINRSSEIVSTQEPRTLSERHRKQHRLFRETIFCLLIGKMLVSKNFPAVIESSTTYNTNVSVDSTLKT